MDFGTMQQADPPNPSLFTTEKQKHTVSWELSL